LKNPLGFSVVDNSHRNSIIALISKFPTISFHATLLCTRLTELLIFLTPCNCSSQCNCTNATTLPTHLPSIQLLRSMPLPCHNNPTYPSSFLHPTTPLNATAPIRQSSPLIIFPPFNYFAQCNCSDMTIFPTHHFSSIQLLRSTRLP
jgi:hypothetical protein